MEFVRRGREAPEELPSLAAVDADEYEAVAMGYAADPARRKSVPSRARELHAFILGRLAAEEESKLAPSLRPATEAAHVLASAETWPSLSSGRVEALAYACHGGRQTRLWAGSGQAFFLLSLTTPSPDVAMLELRDYLADQPAWQRLFGLDLVLLLAEAGLLPQAAVRAVAMGSEASMWDIECAWTTGLGTGLLEVMGKF